MTFKVKLVMVLALGCYGLDRQLTSPIGLFHSTVWLVIVRKAWVLLTISTMTAPRMNLHEQLQDPETEAWTHIINLFTPVYFPLRHVKMSAVKKLKVEYVNLEKYSWMLSFGLVVGRATCPKCWFSFRIAYYKNNNALFCLFTNSALLILSVALSILLKM